MVMSPRPPWIAILLMHFFFIDHHSGSVKLRAERVDPLRKRGSLFRDCLPDHVGRSSTRHDFLSAVHRGKVHGTQGLSSTCLQAGPSSHGDRPSGSQSGNTTLPTRLRDASFGNQNNDVINPFSISTLLFLKCPEGIV